jgi:hypothetical protein
MCEILVKAVSVTNPDPDKDQRGCYKRGYLVLIMPDGHVWGREEGLPKFVVIKLPGVPVDNEKIRKYTEEWKAMTGLDPDGGPIIETQQRRRWQIRWVDLPQAARNKLASTGELVIKAGSYLGPSDYTWAQIKHYFRNLETGLDEIEDLV